MEEGAIEVRVAREEIIIEGADTGEMKKGAAAAMVTEVVVVVVMGGGGGGGGEVDAGEERFEGRIAVDEGGEEVGPVVNVGAEDEDERGEEEEEEEMGNEDGGGVLEELGGGVVVDCR